MPYLPLDRERNEVRVLTLESTVDESKLVKCALEQVSLDDLMPEYKEYISELESEYSKPVPALNSFNGWVEHSQQNSSSTQLSKRAFMIPLWRWTHHEDFHNGCPITENDDASAYQLYAYSHDLVLENSGDALPSDSIPILPRYRWGDFEALSYCWESEELEKEIILDGRRTRVPKNLEAALQALRLLPEVKSEMKFWVDFLCICQNYTAEKNHQVKLMRKIYASAMSVIAWIGSEADQSDKAIDLMERIDMSTGGSHSVEQAMNVASLQSFYELGSCTTPPLREAPLISLEALLSRDYWKRLWIIQELALNHSMTLFLCGNKSFSRSMIMRMCKFCMNRAEEIDSTIRSQERKKQ